MQAMVPSLVTSYAVHAVRRIRTHDLREWA